MDVVQKFLVSGPTSRIMVIPQQVLDTFGKVNAFLEEMRNSVTAAVELQDGAHVSQLFFYFYTVTNFYVQVFELHFPSMQENANKSLSIYTFKSTFILSRN